MLNRFSYIFLLGLLALAAFLYIHYTRSGGNGSERFTGVDRCRVCHESASSGAQFGVWSNGPHAHAYQALHSDSARAYLARGASKFTMDSCLACHTTLGHQAGTDVEMPLVAEGVGCERCHGPGSNYAEYNTMMHVADVKAHGGVTGSLNDCYQCHAASVGPDTRHCPFQYNSFNADSAWPRIKHPTAKNSRTADTVLKLRQ